MKELMICYRFFMKNNCPQKPWQNLCEVLRFSQFWRFLQEIVKEFDDDHDGDDFTIVCHGRPTGHFDGLQTASTNEDPPHDDQTVLWV